MGRGSERVLPPRYVLEGARRAEVIAMVERRRRRARRSARPRRVSPPDAPHLLLHRRSHRRQPRPPRCGRGAVAEGRVDVGAAAGFPDPLRLDPHRAVFRTARPRHDVGRVPVSADDDRCRYRHPVHRDVGLPADVRARHDRHGDVRAGAWVDPAGDAGAAEGRGARRRHRHRLRDRGRQGDRGAHHQRPRLCRREGCCGRCRGHRAAQHRRRLWRQLLRDHRTAGAICRARRDGREPAGRTVGPHPRGGAREMRAGPPARPDDPRRQPHPVGG